MNTFIDLLARELRDSVIRSEYKYDGLPESGKEPWRRYAINISEKTLEAAANAFEAEASTWAQIDAPILGAIIRKGKKVIRGVGSIKAAPPK